MAQHSILVVGCGSIGERHLRCFQKTGRARVTACDSNAALTGRMASTYGVATTQDWSSAVRDDQFDGVVICTPAHLHVDMAITALKAGRHALIEKPLSQSLDNVDALVRLAAESSKRTAVAYVYHMIPCLAQARDAIRAGVIGPVRQGIFSGGQPFQRLRPAYPNTYYRDRRMGGGAIQDALTHWVNWVESVLGPTDSLVCDCEHLYLPGVTVEDTVHVSARNGGVLVSYNLNQFQAPNETVAQFNGENGSVRIEVSQQRWGVFRPEDKDWTWTEAHQSTHDLNFIAQADGFLDLIEGKPANLCSVAAAAQTLRFNLAAIASAEGGTRVKVEHQAGL